MDVRGFIFVFLSILSFYTVTPAHIHLSDLERHEPLQTDILPKSFHKEMIAANANLQSLNTSVLFYLYSQSSVDKPQQLWLNNLNSIHSSYFKASRKTMVVIHGYQDSVGSAITQDIKNALLKTGDFNVIGVDWSAYTKSIIYSWVVTQTPDVGTYVGQFVDYLIEQSGISPSLIHLIGHSLGAHAAGFAGKELEGLGKKVARISGLDAALPGFNGDDPSSRLSSTDADFVDCIHTCAGLLGYDIAICQADFYPNGGENEQPGCPWYDFGVCSHGRSFEYFAESINASHHFYAETCNAVVDGVPYGCSTQGAQMGYYATPEYLGTFYLKTGSSSPYSLDAVHVP